METNIQKYLAFVKAAELGNLTEVGKKLNYSQSGISRMISDLEEEWGITLLKRDKYGVHLTTDGESILPYARNLCVEFDRLQRQVDDVKGILYGVIRIGAFSSVASHWLPSIIKKFHEDFPGVDYNIMIGDYTEIEQWLTNGEVDCAFLRLPVSKEFYVQELQKDPLMAVIPADHQYADADCFPLKEFEKKPFLLAEQRSKTDISALFDKYNLSPRVQFSTWDDYAVLSMVEKGLGIAILPKLILEGITYNVIIKPLEVPAFRDIGFVVKDIDSIPYAVKRFMEYLDYREIHVNTSQV